MRFFDVQPCFGDRLTVVADRVESDQEQQRLRFYANDELIAEFFGASFFIERRSESNR